MYRGSTRRILIPSRGCVFGLGDILRDTGRCLYSSCASVYRGSTSRILISSRGRVFGVGDILDDTGRCLFSSCASVSVTVNLRNNLITFDVASRQNILNF